MLQLNFNPFPILTTDRLVLRQAHPDDVDEVFFLRSDKEVMKYIDRKPCQSIDEAAAFITMLSGLLAANEGISWTIALKGSEKMIGSIGFWRLEKEHYRAEIGYVLHPDHQGKGIMHEAMTATLTYGFETMKLHSVGGKYKSGKYSIAKGSGKTWVCKRGLFQGKLFL